MCLAFVGADYTRPDDHFELATGLSTRRKSLAADFFNKLADYHDHLIMFLLTAVIRSISDEYHLVSRQPRRAGSY